MTSRLGISMSQLAKSIRERQENKWDAIIIVDGPRGNGKSTFLYKLFTQLGGFIPEKDIVFSRKDLIDKLKEKYGLIFQDEMINAAHNRDFYEKDQKRLVKMLNMYRDNFNIMGGAVPFFYDLDPQMRKFVALRVTIYDRGKAILQKPGKSIYSNDPWDTDVNRKLELNMRKINKKGNLAKFNFTKLSTFWGTLDFGPLRPRQEKRYEKIKADKRYQLIEAEEDDSEDKSDPIQVMAINYDAGMLTTDQIKAWCDIQGEKYITIMNRISKIRRNKPKLMAAIGHSGLPLVSQAPFGR